MSRDSTESDQANEAFQYIVLPYAANAGSLYLALTANLPLFALVLLFILNAMFFGVATYTLMTGNPPNN